MAKYHCKNFGSCPKADAHEELEIAPGMDPLCPECGMTLTPAEAQTDGTVAKKWMVPAVIGVVAVVMAGGGYWWWQSKQKAVVVTAAGVAVEALTPVAKQLASAAADALKDKLSGQPAPGTAAGAPSEGEIDALKKAGEAGLVKGDAQGASKASERAVVLEMVKTAIAYLGQGDLAKAESELNTAKARAPGEPLVYYNLAVVRIKQRRTDDAFTLLETAFAKGFKGLDAMARDPDLAPLRKDARYQALLDKYRKG